MHLIVGLVGDIRWLIILVTDDMNILHGICIPYEYSCLRCVVHIGLACSSVLEISFCAKCL